MRKKLAYTFALLSILLVISTTYTPALATTYQLGVQAGNTGDYTATISGNSNVTKAHMSVHNVTGSVAGLDFTFIYPNGTVAKSSSISVFVDVTSTNGSDLGWIFLIGKNLTNGNPIYPTAPYMINATTTMIVAGVNRTVNRLSIGDTTFFWDKNTGTIVKMNFHFFGWINITMTATNMWSAAGLFGLSTTTLLIIGGVVLVIIVAAVLLLRRRK